MAPSGREVLRNSVPPAAASAEIRPIRLGGVVPSPFIRKGRQAGLVKRFVASDRPEFQQGDARASNAMGIPGQARVGDALDVRANSNSRSCLACPRQSEPLRAGLPTPAASRRQGVAGARAGQGSRRLGRTRGPIRLLHFLFHDPGRAATGSQLRRLALTLRARLPPAPPPNRHQEPLCTGRVDLSLAGDEPRPALDGSRRPRPGGPPLCALSAIERRGTVPRLRSPNRRRSTKSRSM